MVRTATRQWQDNSTSATRGAQAPCDLKPGVRVRVTGRNGWDVSSMDKIGCLVASVWGRNSMPRTAPCLGLAHTAMSMRSPGCLAAACTAMAPHQPRHLGRRPCTAMAPYQPRHLGRRPCTAMAPHQPRHLGRRPYAAIAPHQPRHLGRRLCTAMAPYQPRHLGRRPYAAKTACNAADAAKAGAQASVQLQLRRALKAAKVQHHGVRT
eukprot:365837-Chlamydomonas_euryale.AAC.2